jgi:ferredoxin
MGIVAGGPGLSQQLNTAMCAGAGLLKLQVMSQPPSGPVYSARLLPDGLPFDAPAGTPLLLSALQAGMLLDSSCRNGTCRSCIQRLASGRVSYRIDWPGLSAEEKAGGWILPCVAYPASDLVLLPPSP